MTVWKTVRDDSCLISYTESYSSKFQPSLYYPDTPMLICLMSEILSLSEYYFSTSVRVLLSNFSRLNMRICAAFDVKGACQFEK